MEAHLLRDADERLCVPFRRRFGLKLKTFLTCGKDSQFDASEVVVE